MSVDSNQDLYNRIRTEVVAWSVRPPSNGKAESGAQSPEVHVPENVSYFQYQGNTQERVCQNTTDTRVRVSQKNFGPGGKYRSICKILTLFERENDWYAGTGFLVANNHIITAGHNVHDESLGHARQITVYIGYHGQHDISESKVRYAEHIAVGKAYHTRGFDQAADNDMAVITLDRPFDASTVSVMGFQYPCDVRQNMTIVGYPQDRHEGERMYEASSRGGLEYITYNMLTYNIPTSGGQSGSPILIQDSRSTHARSQVAIGVHTTGNVVRNKGILFDSTSNHVDGFLKALLYQKSPANIDPLSAEKVPIHGSSTAIHNLCTLIIDG